MELTDKAIKKIRALFSVAVVFITVSCLSNCDALQIPTEITTDVFTEVPTDVFTEVPTDVFTEAPTDVFTDVPTNVIISPLEVDVKVSFDDCSCGGTFQKAIVTLNIENGTPPFSISGGSPVSERLVTFPVPIGSFFPLVITSSEGLSWETERIDASTSNSCQPPQSCKSSNENGGDSCQEQEVTVCEEVEVIKVVCIDWAGQSGNCKEWGEEVTLEEVCTTEVVCQ